MFLKGKNMDKFMVQKEIGNINGCKLILQKETNFTNSDDAFLDINSAEIELSRYIELDWDKKNNG